MRREGQCGGENEEREGKRKGRGKEREEETNRSCCSDSLKSAEPRYGPTMEARPRAQEKRPRIMVERWEFPPVSEGEERRGGQYRMRAATQAEGEEARRGKGDGERKEGGRGEVMGVGREKARKERKRKKRRWERTRRFPCPTRPNREDSRKGCVHQRENENRCKTTRKPPSKECSNS